MLLPLLLIGDVLSFSFYLESGFGLRYLVCFIREAQMLILRALIFHGAETAGKVGVLM